MRKIIVITFITMDGVMQSPGGAQEDPSGGFSYGGWVAPYGDDDFGKEMLKQMQPSDLLLGRKTFDIFASFWPQHAKGWPGINEATKYVLSSTVESADWENCVFLKTVEEIQKLKQSSGPDLKVWGSSELVHLLLKHELVDELWLKIYPIILGKGKKLFNDESTPAAFTMVESLVTSTGVIVAYYKHAGQVMTKDIVPEY